MSDWRPMWAAALTVLALVTGPGVSVARSQGGCPVSQVPGGVDIAIEPTTNEVVVATAGLRIFRSSDGGASYASAWLDPAGSWPSLGFLDTSLYLAAGRWGPPSEIFVLRSPDGGTTFLPETTVYSSEVHQLIDPELVMLANGDMLVFLTEIVIQAPDPARFVVRLFRSVDQGLSWWQLPDPIVGPPGIKIEDPKAIELADGDVLLAYEYEIEDLGASRIEQIRSGDGGVSWDPPTVLWDDVPVSDDEPGGYQPLADDEIWFLASTDEDSVETYTDAVVKGRTSNDGGLTWGPSVAVIPEPDQIVFGSAMDSAGHVLVATVRHYSITPRILNVYHVDPDSPGAWGCRPLVFVDGLDSGGPGRWSSVFYEPSPARRSGLAR